MTVGLSLHAVAHGVIARSFAVGTLALGAWAAPLAHAQTAATPVLISSAIDEHRLVRLAGNVRPEAVAANDRGRVPDSMPLQHMQLLLKRPAEREQALQRYIAELHDRSAPSFHHWLSAAEFGARFGVSQQDLATITGWLKRRGFTVNAVYPSTMVIDFSGTAGELRNVFRSEIHALSVRGVHHIANMSDPQIPAALAPAVVGIVSLHDFRPHAMHRPRAAYTVSSGQEAVVPADLATIYNLNPLLSTGITGQGQTIALIEDTDLYSTADWSTFRSTFGLSGYSTGALTQVHPGGANNCSDPGVVSGVDGEAILDAEWSSAAAPGAAIEVASCADGTTTFGGLIALENLINASGSPPAIMSISYGDCEAENGASANAAYSAAYQQAVTEGVSVFVSAGDEGAAGCDADANAATHGIGVSGFASTPYNVAVGGTDFGDTYAGTTAVYWSSTSSPAFGSALSYIPEIPWNDSCASVLLSTFKGYATPYGSAGFCNSTTVQTNNAFLTTAAGSGGPSECAAGSPATPGVVGGSCTGAPKPSWQSGVPGIPGDGVRDLPDVSLFAANGVWGHYYVYCWSDVAAGGASCTGAPSSWSAAGGTSFSSPILAGIQALVNQSTAARQGNPNPVYYGLAASQSASHLACNSSSGNAVASSCVFYDITTGDMDVNCSGSSDCYLAASTNGVLSTSDTAYAQAYGAAVGWDFATGLGSVNAANLVKNWNSSSIAAGAGTARALPGASGGTTPSGLDAAFSGAGH
jgi:subtilase family serine protease